MEKYADSLDPSEVKDFSADWSGQIGEGDMITAIDAVTFINAAGTTQPSPASFTGNITRVWLTGGNHGETAVFLVRITTVGQRTLERSFSVVVVDNAITISAETDVERITREITEIKAQRHKVMTGDGVIEVQRDGRRVKKFVASLREFEQMIATLDRELAEATAIAAGSPRRRPVRLGWAN